ncbi:MAG: cytochrome P450 [Segetibacter sp.]
MSSSFNEPEVIKKSILLGNTFQVLKDPVDFLGKLTRDYGPVVTANFLGKKYFVLQHPEYIKNVLLQNHKTYYKPGATKLLRLFLGEGLSTSNGELWLRQRRIMQPAFHKQRLLLILHIINEETTSFIARLNSRQSISALNINHEFLQLTISIISRAMFSTALKEEMKTMVDALEALAVYASSWMKSLIKIPTHWPTPANAGFNSNCKVFDDIIYGMIDKRRKEMNDSTLSQHGDLLDMLMEYYDEESKCVMSEKQLRDEVTTMFMAGHETTAQTLSWIMYHLSKEKEMHHTVKNEGSIIFNERLPALEDLPRLVYTKQVIQEALRCYPPVWALVRKPLADTDINGIKVPAMSNVLINIYGMHQHPGFWQTPDAFNPSHFNIEEQEQRPQFAYLPFGGGPRLCLGNNFAMMVMQVVVSRLSQHFEFDVPDGYVPKVEPNITLRAKDGIQLVLKK